MLQFVLRCYRVPASVGKSVRHAIRHHWNVGHRAARVIYHGGIVTGVTLVCVAVPMALAALPPSPDEGGPVPEEMGPSDRGFGPVSPDSPPTIPFVPGLLFYPPGQDIADIGPIPHRVAAGPSTSDRKSSGNKPQSDHSDVLVSAVVRPPSTSVAEPASIVLLGSGLGLLVLLRRITRMEPS